jgi:hypothetical protein
MSMETASPWSNMLEELQGKKQQQQQDAQVIILYFEHRWNTSMGNAAAEVHRFFSKLN